MSSTSIDSNMSESEVVALEWITDKGVDEYDIEREDQFQSIDFIIKGRLCVEVKTDEYYHISSTQLESMAELDEVMVVIVPESMEPSDVWVEDIITSVEMSDESALTGQSVASDEDKYADDIVNLRATMDSSDFNRFKSVKSELGADTNDEAIMALVEEYQSSPDTEEAIKFLEDQGFEVVRSD